MSKKNEHNSAEKLTIVQALMSGKMSRVGVARKHNISVSTLVKWRHQYELYGVEGLAIRTRNNSYSAELKLKAVQNYFTKGRTTTQQERIDIVLYCQAHNPDYRMAADQYQVSYHQVYQWVKKYAEGGQDALKDGRGRRKPLEEPCY
ncbi:helix-turn-helix domain-containing protein [Paenibacillus lycopersici]|uniref:Helix-turn-helix domain-containing protein n=1 Tax=Paenibacillus lycopersici TaxID=2704462 RepID=A0A6C0G6K9_9BACL|nr:helix-turn-helix domain-containing protein [Paenibacillus lycopersici]QHT63300.1 helix-turn-helix domain-containing protein [Paenibacillus lycopersici]